MTKNKLLTLLSIIEMLLGIISSGYTQELWKPNTTVSSSPTAASLGQYIDFPVTLSNGLPNINIPLYELHSSRITVPISLSYHSGGIKVSERTSTMGLGWSLVAGGGINRVVNGLPDEGSRGFLNMVFPDEERPNSGYKLQCLANKIYNHYIPNYFSYDGQPDMFYYNFQGINGKFAFRNQPALGAKPQIATLPYAPIKIDYQPGDARLRPTFIITNTDGTIYEFGKDDRTDISTIGVSNAADYYKDENENGDSYENSFTSAWYLTKIISADKSDTVSFVYAHDPIAFYHSRIMTYLFDQRGPDPVGGSSFLQTSRSYNQHSETNALLKEINCRSGKIIFNYKPDQAMPALETIDIYANGSSGIQKIKTFSLETSFFDTHIGAENVNTLRLDKVTEMGYQNSTAVSKPPYVFSYATNVAPPYETNSQDIWGYYNGHYNVPDNDNLTLFNKGPQASPIYTPEKRAANPDYMGEAILTRITYPTGGFSAFEFEPNQMVTPLPVPIYTPGTNLNVSTMNMSVGGGSNGTDATFTPSPNCDGTAQFYFSGSLQCSSGSYCVYGEPKVIITDLTTNTIILARTLDALWAGSQTSESLTLTLTGINTSHQYRMYLPVVGTLTNASQSTRYRLTATYVDNVIPNTEIRDVTVYGGGLRIKNIIAGNENKDSVIKSYNYPKPYFNSNIFDGTFDFIRNSMIQQKHVVNYTYYYSEFPSFPVGGASNCAISYEEVEEVRTNSLSLNATSLGKTVYTYSKAQDYVYPRLMIRNDQGFIRDQLINVKVYKKNTDGSFSLLKVTKNTYRNLNNINDMSSPGSDSIKYYVITSDFDFVRWRAEGGSVSSETFGGVKSMGCPIYEATLPFREDGLFHHIVKTLLDSTVETVYDPNTGGGVTEKSTYIYDNLNHLQPTKIIKTNSRNGTNTTIIKYSLDFSSSCNRETTACLANFRSTLNSLKTTRDAQQQGAINNTSYNDYDQFEQQYTDAATAAVNNYNQCTASNLQTYNTCKAQVTGQNRALMEMTDRNMINPSIEVTEQLNGSFLNKKVNSFGFAGNVVFPSAISTQTLNFPLEERVKFYNYDNAGNLLEQSKSNDVHEVYIWGYKNQYPVAKIVGSDYTTVIGLISPAILNNINITDTQLRAELQTLRTGLPNALVTTYTYAPLLGVTSETDPRGATIYYEYDAFGRLKLVKDQDGKILKQYDYQFQKPITQ